MTITTTDKAPKQVAVNDIGSADDFLAAVEKTLKFFNDGDLIEGTVVKIDRDEVLLDVGYKTEGVIPSRELSIKHDVDPTEVVKVGDSVEALVLQKEDKEGRLILSKKRAQYERAWGDVEKIKDADGVVTGTVIEVVKGGLIVDIGLRGFLPASLIELRRVRDLTPYLGQEIEAKILELDKNRNNVVLSRRALLEQTQSESRTTFLNNLAKGQVRKGVVSSIVNFGAFVDLGGVDGLVHVSELSWKHIEHASEVVEVGQEVTVEILEVDLDRERVSLSLKATQEDPWQVFARTHAIGQVAPGKVTKLVPFGAFVRVAEGIEGLVHISELSGKHVELAEQVVSVGDEVFVKVIDIDLERRRISLSLKQANEGVDPEGTEFDPALYGMLTEYDEQGNYKYPEGFDPETNEWKDGFEEQRAKWEADYAAAQARWEQHKKQVAAAALEESTASVPAGATSFSSEYSSGGGTLADDESLAALREKLSINSESLTSRRPVPSGVGRRRLCRSIRRSTRGSAQVCSGRIGIGQSGPASPTTHDDDDADDERRDEHEHEDRQQECAQAQRDAAHILRGADDGRGRAARDGVEHGSREHLARVRGEGQDHADRNGNPGTRGEELPGIGHDGGAGRRARAERDAAGHRAHDRLNPVVDGIHDGNLVGDDLQHEEHTQDPEHPRVLEPRPGARQFHEVQESTGEPEDEQRDVRIQAGRDGEAGTRQELHRASSQGRARRPMGPRLAWAAWFSSA